MIAREQPRKTVAVDLDQTLAHTLDALVSWHNDVYHTNYTVADFHTYNFCQVWGGSKEEACAKIRQFYDSDHFDQISPIHDFALEALKMLKKRRFNLVIITARQQFIAEATKKFVDRHYPGLFESIYFCNLNLSDAEQLEYVSKPKSLICQEINVDVLIDDTLEHALDCASLGIQVLLYDRKGQYRWNHTATGATTRPTLTSTSKQLYSSSSSFSGALPANVKRVRSWKDIIASFPKPSSPLRTCYYPHDFLESESEEDFDDGSTYVDHNNPYGYETIEIDELTEDEDDDCMKKYTDDPSWKDQSVVWV
ncbi:hypothetical protein DFQ28_011111 [Apophysomyces sp. BC1034]|nr:hypothetical protein DFQ30_007384 [Apophysomyces sp. BC1015]KAG0182743.1 hypothetical protein DFQ29_002378 [Apophysomyces sp. BC1021]KAG0191719.1 hypothetical protein DFQ28_011111 [Apophysomyces sp. BC1034]